jgi:hypothetical protein
MKNIDGYAGLAPGVYQSDAKNKSMKITSWGTSIYPFVFWRRLMTGRTNPYCNAGLSLETSG